VNEADDVTGLDIELITGRYHQIRAQMAGTGHPIVNDVKYGAKKGKTGKNVTGIELCAYSLSFDHPVSGRRMEFTLDPDE
jgi:23S rRNA pseudouridine1911/1915/1917 synthase